MPDTTQHLADVLDAHAPVNNTEVFNYLLNVREQAWELVQTGLSLREDRRCQDIQDIRDLQGNTVGNIHTYTGAASPVDWLIRSWIGKPESGFTNIHLTGWLSAAVDVPHLGFALGTAPEVFCYVDFLPRYDLATNPDYAEQFYEPVNALWTGLKRSPAFKAFNPVHLYTRAVLSPVAVCGLLPLADFRAVVEPVMLAYVQQWVDWVRQAAPTPADQRPALRQRDTFVRQNIVERDPANVLADRMLGVPMRERLVRILRGAERE